MNYDYSLAWRALLVGGGISGAVGVLVWLLHQLRPQTAAGRSYLPPFLVGWAESTIFTFLAVHKDASGSGKAFAFLLGVKLLDYWRSMPSPSGTNWGVNRKRFFLVTIGSLFNLALSWGVASKVLSWSWFPWPVFGLGVVFAILYLVEDWRGWNWPLILTHLRIRRMRHR